MSRSYTVTALTTVFLVSFCIAAFCFIADPYRLYPAIPNISPTPLKTHTFRMRLHVPYDVARVHPSTLIVGNSRSASLPPGILEKPGDIAFNASLPGATIGETRRMVEHAHANSPLKQVFVGIDLPMLWKATPEKMMIEERDRYRKMDPSLSDRWKLLDQQFDDHWNALFSVKAIMISWSRLFGDGKGDNQYDVLEDGTWNIAVPVTAQQARGPYQNRVRQLYESHKTNRSGRLELDELDELLDFTESHNIKTTLFLPPLQGLLLNVVEFAGNWAQYLDWQRELVMRVDARNSNTEIYGVEDHASIVLEAIEAPQRLFRDGVHFAPRAGVEILTCFAGPCNPAFKPTRLDSLSIDAYLEQIDVLRRQYAQDNPTEVAKARKLLKLN